jgi:hypothetical protein
MVKTKQTTNLDSVMNNESMLDEVFQSFTTKLEYDYMLKGACAVKLDLDDYSIKELDELILEIEEKYEQTIDRSDLLETFAEAVDYIEEIYRITKHSQYDAHEHELLVCAY